MAVGAVRGAVGDLAGRGADAVGDRSNIWGTISLRIWPPALAFDLIGRRHGLKMFSGKPS